MTIKKIATRVLLPALVAALLAPATSFAAKGILKLHEGDWTGHLVFGQLAKIILEEHMDYKVKMVFMPAGPGAQEAIIAGEIDIGFESWPSYSPTKEKYIKEFGGDGSQELVAYTGIIGQSGYYVPRYVVEGDSSRGIAPMAPDLKSYQDLNKYTALFQTPETAPKGRLVACPVAAWQCKDDERVAGLGLEYETVVLGSETAHWAELEAAYNRGDPILVYAWEPHWVHAKFDLVEVGLPPHSDSAWPVSDWPEDRTYHIARPAFKEKYPDAYQLLKNLHLTNEQQATMILDVDVNKVPLEDAVRKWMAANEGVWQKWIP